MTDDQPAAFVIMPFGEGFDEVYNLFVAETLGQAGYAVVRADDVRTQQNILKDIVVGIATADLVVADLTDSNPNVFYELGVAHGLRRPVILLTQKLDELPFDLRSYRVIPYSTHFAEIREAKERLLEIARQTSGGSLSFGSPVTDFLGGPARRAVELPEQADRVGAGFLDHLVNLEEGFQALTDVITEHNEETARIGTLTSEATARLQSSINQKQIRAARTVVMGLAQRLGEYAQKLADRNDRYANSLGETGTAVDFIVRAQKPDSAEALEQLRSFLQTLAEAEQGALSGRAATSRFAEAIRGIPNIERTFSRAASRTVHELERFVDNIDQTISMISRTREVGAAKLAAAGPPNQGLQPTAPKPS